MILDTIVAQKKIQIEQEKKLVSTKKLILETKKCCNPSGMDFFEAIHKKGVVSIIAEVKKASPSKGVIKELFDPVEIARLYCAAKADAISVLTEKSFFLGKDDYLVKIRKETSVPLLRKDFIVDLWQIYQSKLLGADAVLLIASVLGKEELKTFRLKAMELGMRCLVEVHDRGELEKALESGAKIIGINNRDLKTFDVSLETTKKLIAFIPEGYVVVSESGIKDAKDMRYMNDLGVNAVLIGETLMRAPSILDKMQELRAE